MDEQGGRMTPKMYAILISGLCGIGLFGIIFYTFAISNVFGVVLSWILLVLSGIFLVLPLVFKGYMKRWLGSAQNSKSWRYYPLFFLSGAFFLMFFAWERLDYAANAGFPYYHGFPAIQCLLLVGMGNVYLALVGTLLWNLTRSKKEAG